MFIISPSSMTLYLLPHDSYGHWITLVRFVVCSHPPWINLEHRSMNFSTLSNQCCPVPLRLQSQSIFPQSCLSTVYILFSLMSTSHYHVSSQSSSHTALSPTSLSWRIVESAVSRFCPHLQWCFLLQPPRLLC